MNEGFINSANLKYFSLIPFFNLKHVRYLSRLFWRNLNSFTTRINHPFWSNDSIEVSLEKIICNINNWWSFWPPFYYHWFFMKNCYIIFTLYFKVDFEMKKWWPLWVMLWLAVLLILCGVLTILHPSGFWKWMNILLWISLLLSGISAIANAIKNQQTQYISILFVIGILGIILWILLICSQKNDEGTVNFVGQLMVWLFALWAFIRWWMLLFFWFQNKEKMPLWWWICTLWLILVLLAIMIAASSRTMAIFVWICIWISIIFDWISLLFFSLKWGNTQIVQAQIISQADSNEIAQWDVVITETVITNSPDNQPQN